MEPRIPTIPITANISLENLLKPSSTHLTKLPSPSSVGLQMPESLSIMSVTKISGLETQEDRESASLRHESQTGLRQSSFPRKIADRPRSGQRWGVIVATCSKEAM
ncbi:hypothetical protein FOQG_08207 [Fusarium oxysporum f. sp. raphani 54005]|uniref:Uncharacterized protein n=3 Tax=Fusarium oxysporum TaxID=5507 RepID=X0CDR5_FUSOX|nr:hypothetical protein FOVG_05890 [Fusarium oxysporum f. sp. pisi HDV247]EXK88969.1 hypothetical protein FOQG_08207 [Fusarium oxysporum f. sp. raphani 54005]EXM33190.1 hypothetical protein FOTG_03272 [Fusarium oxysporum f. sp. vasinfectum 25433]